MLALHQLEIGLACLGFPGLSGQRSQSPDLLAGCVKIFRREPLSQGRLAVRPLILQHGEPCHVTLPAIHNRRSPPCSFIGKSKILSGFERFFILCETAPHQALITKVIHRVAHQQEYCFSRRSRSLERRREPDAADLDAAFLVVYVAYRKPTLCLLSFGDHDPKWLIRPEREVSNRAPKFLYVGKGTIPQVGEALRRGNGEWPQISQMLFRQYLQIHIATRTGLPYWQRPVGLMNGLAQVSFNCHSVHHNGIMSRD